MASNQSFQMVDMQHQQFEDQQDQLEAEPQQQQHQQLEEQQQQQQEQQQEQQEQQLGPPILPLHPLPPLPAVHPQFGEWQEDEELAIAIAMSLHDAQIRDAELASSSSRSCHSKSSAATTPAISVAKKKKKESFIVKKKKDEEKLATIQEEHFNISQYVGTSGCMGTFFTADEEDGSCMVCPDHGLNHQPHCRHCANHQHMVLKHKHDVAQHTVILASVYQSGEITWVERDGKLWATCSKHSHHDMQENCSACLQIVEMLDDGSCVKPIGDAPA